jgi:hypothetical protein
MVNYKGLNKDFYLFKSHRDQTPSYPGATKNLYPGATKIVLEEYSAKKPVKTPEKSKKD